MITTVVEKAWVKVNLTLHVLERWDNGYHNLDSLVVFGDFADELHLERAEKDEFFLFSNVYGSIDSADNLCIRALHALRQQDCSVGFTKISLHKNIPVAAGLGGGSADAAAVLRGLCRLWGLQVHQHILQEVAQSLGADVPVCLSPSAQRMQGLGEKLTKLYTPSEGYLLLVNDGIPVSTAEVFKGLPRQKRVGMDQLFELQNWSHLSSERFRNDLELSAFVLNPDLPILIDEMRALPGCLRAGMSGSGGTCFALFNQMPGDVVQQACEKWREQGVFAEICRIL